MSTAVDFVQTRGEIASLLVVLLLLGLSAGPTARLLAVGRGAVTDVFFNGAIAFVVVGRLVYIAMETPRTLLDPLVLLRFQGGIEPLAGAAAVMAMAVWRSPSGDARARWVAASTAAVGLAVATLGYDLACVARDACYGAGAPPPLGFQMSGFSEPRMATPLIEATLLLATGTLLLAAGRRIRIEAAPLMVIGALALFRAVLTPASTLGTDAIGIETGLLAAVAAGALGGAAWLNHRATRPDGAAPASPATVETHERTVREVAQRRERT